MPDWLLIRNCTFNWKEDEEEQEAEAAGKTLKSERIVQTSQPSKIEEEEEEKAIGYVFWKKISVLPHGSGLFQEKHYLGPLLMSTGKRSSRKRQLPRRPTQALINRYCTELS
ncbi:uncharacterized protein LOC110010103 [Jatropha curcas]|uniref:uncharacterized protein LOC110010103 n=1 Tax=Jatropha curcas TaxID=180498 RepID=UPI00189390A7|nr:uncharacterized protein LOC110010103 [Jatropha curcas]